MAKVPNAQQRLGKEVKLRRKELGYSQEGFAHNCGVHRTYMGQIERGAANPTLEILFKISEQLELRPSELLKRAGA